MSILRNLGWAWRHRDYHWIVLSNGQLVGTPPNGAALVTVIGGGGGGGTGGEDRHLHHFTFPRIPGWKPASLNDAWMLGDDLVCYGDAFATEDGRRVDPRVVTIRDGIAYSPPEEIDGVDGETIAEALAAEKELARDLSNYADRWVAVANHKVVAAATTLKDLLDITGVEGVDGIFRVAAGAGFYPNIANERRT